MTLAANQFVSVLRDEVVQPVSFRDIQEEEIQSVTTKLSIRMFKEYEKTRQAAADGRYEKESREAS